MAKRKAEEIPVDDPETEEKEGETPDPTRHVFLDGGMFDIETLGIDNPRERRIIFQGANFEHVSDHESGCWEYRRM